MPATAVHNHHHHFPQGGASSLASTPGEVCVATFANGDYHSVHADLETAKRNLTSYHGAHLTFHDNGHKVKVVANYDDGGTITLYWLHPNEEVR